MKTTLSDGVHLYFDVHGSEREIAGTTLVQKPTLIFLHGGPGLADHNLYAPFWSQFKNIAQVIFLDMRGHGLSGGWNQEEKFNLTSWAADLKEFCDKQGIEKPIVLGFSFGGWIALQYAIDYPDHPGALILCNTEAKIDVPIRAKAYAAKAIRKGLGKAKAEEIEKEVTRLGTSFYSSKETASLYLQHCVPLFSEKDDSPEETSLSLCKKNPLAWEVFDRDEQFKFDHTPRLGEIICPVLSISGELDVEHPAICAKKMCEKMKNADVQHVILPGVGDPIDHDDPEGTNAAVTDFILRLYPDVERLL